MKKLLLLILILAIAVFGGCNKEDLPYTTEKIEAPEESESKYVMYDPIDKSEDTRGTDMTFESFKTYNITYWFDSTVEMDKRVKYVSDTYMVINYLREKYNLTDIPEYYISPDFYNHIEKDAVYLKLDEESSCIEEFIIQTMFKLTDKKCNYGLIYGISKQLEKELKIIDDKSQVLDNSEILTFIEKNTEVMDLTLPVFLTEYYKEDEIEKSRYIAKEFVNYIIEKYGEDKLKELLLSSSELTLDFDKEYKKYCDEWLKSIGCNIALQDETLPVRYEIYGDEHYPIAITTEWMKYCFHRGFEDDNTEITGYDGAYIDVKECIHTFEKEMKDVRDYLPVEYTKKYVEGLVCYFDNNYGIRSEYNAFEGVFLKHIDSFVHEYAHVVSLEPVGYRVPSLFMREGIAQYCKYKFDIYFKNTDIKYLEKCKNSDNTDANRVYEVYSKYQIDNNIGYNTFDSYELFFIRGYEYIGPKLLDDADTYNYLFSPLFVNYLINQSGIDKFMTVFNDYSNTYFYTNYKKSFSNMKIEFINYLREKYKNYME
ncbi:hypothetical protein JYG23_01190 [Sedimentibacter sp. zth1]|uniref:hypothetical protein n=1 Tax=Sedimentibacter sp. zth1 TaxID=2816908 RepID=UPI001A932C85|nr:hypothetical protein [Sedimentibacter sp. zth1]QSX06111.1 hypothetical protein JYG23_01190 [Sedimentibacter sp. zth1]